MIVVDTDVVSELLRKVPADAVSAWFRSHPRRALFITSVTVAEILRGIDRLPTGRRRSTLEEGADTLLVSFEGQVLPFDNAAAFAYADVVDDRVRAGRPIDIADGQIASICRSRGVPLATRNTKDFEQTGIELIDPWSSS